MSRSEARNNKRRFGSRGYAPHVTAPRRGTPAIFVTCESGRERKCQREALDLIHHYYYSSRPDATRDDARGSEEGTPSSSAGGKAPEDEGTRPLSLEEELVMLRKGAAAEEVLSFEASSKLPRTGSAKSVVSSKQISAMKSPFSIYDMGVRGMVCIVCILPGCEMVPYDEIMAVIRARKEKEEKEKEEGGDATQNTTEKEDSKTGEENKNDAVVEDPKCKPTEERESKRPDALWDAVETVRCIMRDATCADKVGDGTNTGTATDGEKEVEQEEGVQKEVSISNELTSPAPGSRFILRILPMQATCYASVEEIKAVSTSLLKQFLPKFLPTISKEGKEVTFKVEFKRRLCSHLKLDEVLGALTPVVYAGLEEMPGYAYKVNLSDPDFFIRIETCKTLCGISILPREGWYKNFNLAELTNPTPDRT